MKKLRIAPLIGFFLGLTLSSFGQLSKPHIKQDPNKDSLNAVLLAMFTRPAIPVGDIHPNAKALLSENFYLSTIEEAAPFGNDDGSDAYYGFRSWRLAHTTTSPLIYLQELFSEWAYPPFDLKEVNPAKITAYINASPVGGRMITGLDAAIVAVGFGQFVREGRIDEELRKLTLTALKRELTPILLREYRENYQARRKELIKKMITLVGKMNN